MKITPWLERYSNEPVDGMLVPDCMLAEIKDLRAALEEASRGLCFRR